MNVANTPRKCKDFLFVRSKINCVKKPFFKISLNTKIGIYRYLFIYYALIFVNNIECKKGKIDSKIYLARLELGN